MNTIKKIVCILCFLTGIKAYGQNPYSLDAVPDSIKKDAVIITHLYDIEFTIENLEKSTLDIHKVVTILNEEGKGELFFQAYTDKMLTLEEAEIRVLDANGKQISKYRKKDMSTTAIGEGLVEDGYMTYFRIPANTYPVTVEFRYQHKIKNTLNIPDYHFLGAKEGVITSSYVARVPPEFKLNYKPKNTSLQPTITEDGKNKLYKWSVQNLKPLLYEESAGPGKYPYVMLTTDQFSYYGVKGDLSSWKSFGYWRNTLYDGQDVLPAARKDFFLNLVKDAPTDKEKIKLIYQYMQQNFRYVSIQLGLGGLKPFSAEFTDQKKYGDCKALSNFMKAALKAVGIKSYVGIINAGEDEEPVDPDFPANTFNHVILCVPSEKDTTWLECTSSTAAFGELGNFTENRYAFLITENGGVLAPTPKSHSSANKLSSTTTIHLENDMSALTETNFNASGAYLEILNGVLKEKADDQKRYIVFSLGFKQPDAFELSKGNLSDNYTARLKMSISKLPEFATGDKVFIGTRVNKLASLKLPKAENRRSDFYFRFPFDKTDTTILKLPAGVKPDQLPSKKELTCKYALYQFNCWFNEPENAVYTTTRLVLHEYKIPAAGYADIKKFFESLSQEDTQKIVVKKGAEAEKKAF